LKEFACRKNACEMIAAQATYLSMVSIANVMNLLNQFDIYIEVSSSLRTQMGCLRTINSFISGIVNFLSIWIVSPLMYSIVKRKVYRAVQGKHKIRLPIRK
jgi:hypothetical protein